MGAFNNNQRFGNADISKYTEKINKQIQTGLKLDSNNNYDIQMEVELSTPDQTDVILVNGRKRMTGDLSNFCFLTKKRKV